MTSVLAYLFWHAFSPAGEVGSAAVLSEFHAALASDPPRGFAGVWTWRLPAPPWFPDWPPVVHLDWYVIENFESLGRLNSAAVTGSRQSSHDQVAAVAGVGSGALFAAVDIQEDPAGAEGPAGLENSAELEDPAGAEDPAGLESPAGPADHADRWSAPRVGDLSRLAFFDKERGVPYREVRRRLGARGTAVWTRQLVLGAGPEFVVVGADPGADPPTGVLPVWSAAAHCVDSVTARPRHVPSPRAPS